MSKENLRLKKGCVWLVLLGVHNVKMNKLTRAVFAEAHGSLLSGVTLTNSGLAWRTVTAGLLSIRTYVLSDNNDPNPMGK